MHALHFSICAVLAYGISLTACSQNNGEGYSEDSRPATNSEENAVLFSKKSPNVSSTVSRSLTAQLTPLEQAPDFPVKNADLHTNGCSRKLVDAPAPGNPLGEVSAKFQANTYLASELNIAVVNDQDNLRFDIWQTDPASNTLKQRLATGTITDSTEDWIAFKAVDVACLPNGKLAIAIGYSNPGSKSGWAILDTHSLTFDYRGEAYAQVRDSDTWFETRSIVDNATLLVYYSDRVRAAREIYHNNYNNVVLFSPAHSDGTEILNLGISDGNIENWFVEDTQLVLATQDMRIPKDHKLYHWTLDLKEVL